MTNRLLKEPRLREQAAYGAESTQVYTWPRWVDFAHILLPALAIALFAVGGILVTEGVHADDLGEVTLGMMAGMSGLALVVFMGVLHGVISREVRFTRESLILQQTLRGRLVLPYATYQREWVADLSNPSLVRVIVFGRNRGCTILFPPVWMLDSLREISRIQEEEGWYEPLRPA